MEKAFVFQEICFKVLILKTFKISSDCHDKTYRSLKWKANLKIPGTVFLRGACALTERQSIVLCYCPHSVYLINPLVQIYVFFNM